MAAVAAERKLVTISGSEQVESHTVYVIEVRVGNHHWTVKHRYSDFHELHEKLVAGKRIDRNLLPPKKIIGKNSKPFVEKRQKELEIYLQTLLAKFPVAAPGVLASFLSFHLYEINGITAALAEQLFHKGEQLLQGGEVFCLRPLQLYAISQQLRLATPPCANGDARTDLGHILDFACRLKYLKITGTRGTVGSSNIQEQHLAFDLSIFKSIHQIEINNCEAERITGLPSLKSSLATMSLSFSTCSMKAVLVPEASEFEQWEVEGTSSERPVAAIIPRWGSLTTLDISHNQISCIDESVKLIPKVEFLDLSYNEISTVENLQHLYNLIHLDLSYNRLTVMQSLHTKLGNVKTLNLSGNQLESLSGFNKLYSLVNLDLSNNKISQIEEVRPIGSLPCLERVSLASNPLSIIPDYRTKVLAQFGDRASEVCLDNTVTSEKELDTVEVLKAIQKAKEAKDRMNNTDRKISEESRHSVPDSKPSPPAHAACPSPPQLPACSSQEIIHNNPALVSFAHQRDCMTPVMSMIPQLCDTESQATAGECGNMSSNKGNKHRDTRLGFPGAMAGPAGSWPLDAEMTPVLPRSWLTYSDSHPGFSTGLLAIARQAALKAEDLSDTNSDCPAKPEGQGQTLAGHTDDGYFEMGQGGVEQALPCGEPTVRGGEGLLQALGGESTDTEHQQQEVLWAMCVHLGEETRLFAGCMAVTSEVVAVFRTPRPDPQGETLLLSQLQLALCFPYSHILALSSPEPELWLSFRLKAGNCLCVIADSNSLNTLYKRVKEASPHLYTARPVLHLPLTDSLSQTLFTAYIVLPGGGAAIRDETPDPPAHTHTSLCSPLLPVSGDQLTPTSLPCLLVLSAQWLHVVKVDFCTAVRQRFDDVSEAGVSGDGVSEAGVSNDGVSEDGVSIQRLPLAAVLLDPGEVERDDFCRHHMARLLVGHQLVRAVFVMPQDKGRFLQLFTRMRAELQGIKAILVHKPTPGHRHTQYSPESAGQKPDTTRQSSPRRSQLSLPLQYPTESLLHALNEENKCPSHLPVSPALSHLAALTGTGLWEYFHRRVAEVENEELRHVMWASVAFYTWAEQEMPACLMLSTSAVYLLLGDGGIQPGVSHRELCARPDSSDLLLSSCFVLKLNSLQCVHIGLFDQYFRISGPSAESIVACLTRDSYTTHTFIQQLMAALSLLERSPSPEPLEPDFYTEFGNKSTGQMENYEIVHASRVKFVYPSEEEVSDLTFVVAENLSEPLGVPACNVLLYALAFRVRPEAGSPLQPQTLILTRSDLLLFEEDYVSYPLPDCAKQPPSRGRYRLGDTRRIRHLDRVLIGYQPLPQAVTFVFDDVRDPDLMSHVNLNHFQHPLRGLGAKGQRAESVGDTEGSSVGGTEEPSVDAEGPSVGTQEPWGPSVGSTEVQWCLFVPSAESREKLIALLARQWELLCSRELPVELTG